MIKRALMLTVAAAALAGAPAHAATITGCDSTNTTDYTDITTKVTVPVCTAEANKGAPGNIVIETNGSVVAAGPTGSNTLVPAATIDSNNIITNKGTIQFTGVTNAIGVQLDTGNTGALDNQGTIDLQGSGTGKIGIFITAPTTATSTVFTGVPLPNAAAPLTTNTAIDLEAGSTLEVTGDDSTGIELDAGSTTTPNSVAGNILINGAITMAPTSTTSSGGEIGVDLAGALNGNFTVGTTGTIGVSGANSEGYVQTGILTGAFINEGSISASGEITSSTNTTTNLLSGSAVLIENNVTGGIYNAGPDTSFATEAAAVLSSAGTTPTVLITPATGATTELEIGKLTDPDNLDNTESFLNRGTISATVPNVNSSTTALRLAGASSTIDVMLDGGIYNSGSIGASATTTAAATNISVAGVFIDDYATVPKLTNFGNGTTNGSISASAAGTGPVVVNAILVNTDGSLAQITNSGTIAASAQSSDPTLTGAALQAYAIHDLSGTLQTIINSGTIEASATTLTDGLQVQRAVDLEDALGNITFTNSGTVTGEVLLGAFDDTLTVVGTSPSAGASVTGNINFGGSTPGGNDVLTIGGTNSPDQVLGKVQEQGLGLVDVTVNPDGSLLLLNDGSTINQAASTTPNLPVSALTVANGGTLGLTLAEPFNTNSSQFDGTAVVELPHGNAGQIMLDAQAVMKVSFGSFVTGGAQGQPAQFVLLDAPGGQLTIADEPAIAQDIDGTSGNSKIPFLFTGSVCTFKVAGSADICTGAEPLDATDSELILNLTPKTAGQLGLTGYAKQMFPLVNFALANDPGLGAAVIGGVNSAAQAQQVYSAFAPDVTGSQRALAISLTDQGTGAVGARQRALRMYAGQDGEATLWGQELTQTLNVGNQVTAGGYKDTGFGFALGMDGGSPVGGRYGAAFTFYSGDTSEKAPRDTKTTSEWYMLTGYTDWRGKGFFLDSQLSVAYGNIDGTRDFDFGGVSRVADGKRAAAMAAGGVTAGVALTAGGTVIMPQVSLDALTMRQEGYTETNNGETTTQGDDAFDLRLAQEYDQSLRAFAGLDIRQDLNFGDFYLQPEGRFGYRYDFVDGADKLKAQFVCSTVTTGFCTQPSTGGQLAPVSAFSITGPDPARGNAVAGASIATTTGAWSIGLNYDYLRGVGSNTAKDSVSQSATITLVGRI